MNPGESITEAINELRQRVKALESHVHASDELLNPTEAPTLPVVEPEAPAEVADVRNQAQDAAG